MCESTLLCFEGAKVIVIVRQLFSYNGPGSQDVSSRWSLEWDHYLASNRDFIVAHMDVRGSGFSGNDFKHAVFHRLGTVEVTDSLIVLK